MNESGVKMKTGTDHIRRRRWIICLLALILVTTACASGGSSPEETIEDTTSSDDTAPDTTAVPGTDADAAGADGKVAVFLPSTIVPRFEEQDRKWFVRHFEDAGLSQDDYMIFNAEGDQALQQQQAEQAITDGATVFIYYNIDSEAAATVVENAKEHGVTVIDYDALTQDGDSDYYVSAQARDVGEKLGEGLKQCVEEAGLSNPNVALLNGGPESSWAVESKEGSDSVLNPLFESGKWTKVADEWVPGWDNQEALVIFEQILVSNKVDAVKAPNDGIANSVVSALKARDLEPVPLTGLDADVQNLQHIVSGWQCMTVYIPLRYQTKAAVEIALAELSGEEPDLEAIADGIEAATLTSVDNGAKELPAIIIEGIIVTEDNLAETVIADEFHTWDEICTEEYAEHCPEDR